MRLCSSSKSGPPPLAGAMATPKCVRLLSESLVGQTSSSSTTPLSHRATTRSASGLYAARGALAPGPGTGTAAPPPNAIARFVSVRALRAARHPTGNQRSVSALSPPLSRLRLCQRSAKFNTTVSGAQSCDESSGAQASLFSESGVVGARDPGDRRGWGCGRPLLCPCVPADT